MDGPDYLWALAELALILLVIGVIAFLLVRALSAARGKPRGPVRVIARVPLEARRTVYLLQIGERAVLIGSSDAGGLQTLAELSPEELAELPLEPDDASPPTFTERLLARRAEGGEHAP